MIAAVECAPEESLDPLILAIDVGTSSSRSLVYDAQARKVIGWEQHRAHELETTPDGGAFLDADALLDHVAGSVDAVLTGVRAAGRRIAAVACDTFWHSILGVGDGDRAVTPVYTWADTRSAGAAAQLRRVLDEEVVRARTGAALHASYVPAKLLWLRETQPDLLSKCSYWMSPGEYLYLRLFGGRRVSISMASGTGLFDQHSCRWDREVLEAVSVREEQLSPIVEFSDAMSGLTRSFRERWPELAETPWYLALGDGACNNVGSGGFSEDRMVAMIGTSGALRVVRENARTDLPEGLWTYRVDRRRFVQGGAFSNGGNVFAWLEETLKLPAIAELEAQLPSMPPDGHGLTVLPFLAGERSPEWNPNARGALIGASLATTPMEIVRASLEAIAYRFALVYRVLRSVTPAPRGIIGSGAGLTNSPPWMQILSDTLGQPMVTAAASESSSRGAAMLVLEAMGVIPLLSALPEAFGAKYAPNREYTDVYERAMERQERLYRLLYGGEAVRDGMR